MRTDLLVIGGGVVGAGIARDAAMRGVNTLLVEQADFASGTSSRSSRLLHGGIRYLAQGKLPLVLEASREKCLLRQVSPHLAEPLPFLFPTYKRTMWPRWKLAVGVRIYDLLCGRQNFGRSSHLSADGLRQVLPAVELSDSTGAVRYFDGFTNDARLVLDTLASAAKHGANIHNYTRFKAAVRTATGWRVTLECTRTGASRELTCTGIINATGVWSPQLAQSDVKIRPTKGVHLVVCRARLEVPEAVVVTDDSRVLFAIPWGDRTILGTTDTDYDGPLDDPACDANDLAYILEHVNRYFPHANLTADDVLSTWAGLRPLVADPNGKPSDISRKHEIRIAQPGWWDVTGGKLTTYRLIAEQAVDRAVKKLGLDAGACRTSEPLIDGAPAEVPYSGCRPPALSKAVVEHFVRNEWAVHLTDIMIRRSSWTHYLEAPEEAAEKVAVWMGKLLGWDAEHLASELGHYQIWRARSRACIDQAAESRIGGTPLHGATQAGIVPAIPQGASL